ncbi:MAG: WD40/YVTN/BNR-like repeat-containing protein, partial [Silanimonas sp.]
VLPSEAMPLASKALLRDLARTSAGLFAVGERGIVLRGDDAGPGPQLTTPTRVALTSVASADGELWVAGHSGVILRSSDNGDTWTRQRLDIWNPESYEPSQGAPILDLMFVDTNTGFAVGAFSTLLRTTDGGQNWTALSLNGEAPAAEPTDAAAVDDAIPVDDGMGFDDSGVLSADELVLEDEEDPHLNAIGRDTGGTLYLAGERGAMFRSSDNGDTWQRLEFPYEGSMFGLLTWDAGHVLAFGLRGNVFESTDGGNSWSRLDTGTEVALMGGSALPGGGAVLVGNEGTILRRADGASPFERTTFQNADGETPVLSGAIPDAAGGLILIGDKGADRHGAR